MRRRRRFRYPPAAPSSCTGRESLAVASRSRVEHLSQRVPAGTWTRERTREIRRPPPMALSTENNIHRIAALRAGLNCRIDDAHVAAQLAVTVFPTTGGNRMPRIVATLKSGEKVSRFAILVGSSHQRKYHLTTLSECWDHFCPHPGSNAKTKNRLSFAWCRASCPGTKEQSQVIFKWIFAEPRKRRSAITTRGREPTVCCATK